MTGGYATGELSAGGSLQQHERDLLTSLCLPQDSVEASRRALNAHFLSDAGLDDLQGRLASGCYDVAVAEEGALPVVSWLVQQGHAEDARQLVAELAPYFARLRFYPIPTDKPRRFGARVHLQNVGEVMESLQRIEPNQRILAQKEAIEIWAPLYDRVVAMFLETVVDDWPCRAYPAGWAARALALLDEYTTLREKHTLRGKMARANSHSAQLWRYLERCARGPEALTGRDVGRIRLILNCYQAKRGAPGSPRWAEARGRQAAAISGPTHAAIAKIVAGRLAEHERDESLDDIGHLTAPVAAIEATRFSVPEGTAIPPSIQKKVARCQNETAAILIERGLISSGETLARVLPQVTAGLAATSIADPTLRRLYASIYRAFRRRRSLLLLNLQRQVQIEELPWIAAIERFRSESLSSQELARQTLEEITALTLTAFPQALLPNKLLQELRALVRNAGLSIPLVGELAADIFMGQFAGTYIQAARTAADLLEGSLYARYYGITYQDVRQVAEAWEPASRLQPDEPFGMVPDVFAELCASRAGVSLGTFDPATNGMIIEQQQILTTQNLAALFAGLDLADALREQLGDMSQRTFAWICRRQGMKVVRWQARLRLVKNSAYAWRQLVFYLSFQPDDEVAQFLRWAEAHLASQKEPFRTRFRPALDGLALAAKGVHLDGPHTHTATARQFLGWSNAGHWLLSDT